VKWGCWHVGGGVGKGQKVGELAGERKTRQGREKER